MLWIHGLTAEICRSRVVGKWQFCLQLLQFCYITVLWIHGLTVVLFVKVGWEMAVRPAVTAFVLHYRAMDTWNNFSVVRTG